MGQERIYLCFHAFFLYCLIFCHNIFKTQTFKITFIVLDKYFYFKTMFCSHLKKSRAWLDEYSLVKMPIIFIKYGRCCRILMLSKCMKLKYSGIALVVHVTLHFMTLLTKSFCVKVTESQYMLYESTGLEFIKFQCGFRSKVKWLGSLTNNFCPVNFEKIILQRASECFNDYKI